MRTVFLRALDADDKATALLQAIENAGSERRFDVDISAFLAVPGSPFSYWVSDALRRPFGALPAFESSGRVARQGLATADDFRFVRAWWEPSSADVRRWFPFAKGGAFSPFYADVFLVVNWQRQGAEIINYCKTGQSKTASRPQNIDFFGRPGITWPRRTNGLSLRVLPSGCVFADKGPAAFVDGDDQQDLLALVAIANSKPFELLVALQLARTELAQSFEVGLIQQTPIPLLTVSDIQRLGALAHHAWRLKRQADSRSEISHAFTMPGILQVDGPDFGARVTAWIESAQEAGAQLVSLQTAINLASFELYGIESAETSLLDQMASEPSQAADPDVDPDRDDETDVLEAVGTYASKLVLASELMSWVLGVAFGRFDLRLATGAREHQASSDPFAALPPCSPGMLTDSFGRPAQVAPATYPVSPADSGLIVDDPGHPNDLSGYVQSVFEAVFGDDADSWLTDVAETLNPAGGGLRRWLADEFFESHLKRYTKSKRRAPIYWQLAVPSGRYSVWLYAPRLTADTFFRLLQDVVAPKVVHEQGTLASLRQGGEPNASREQRELEDQENLVTELREFADEIQRVAPLWNPNLDDGIVLAMSPLWRLASRHKAWQKELRSKWQELQSGKYDWAHIAMHLWPERVVEKCATERSLAIAHGLEEEFWIEGDKGKWIPRQSPLRPIEELVAERTSSAVKDALKSLLEAPEPVATSKRSRKSRAS